MGLSWTYYFNLSEVKFLIFPIGASIENEIVIFHVYKGVHEIHAQLCCFSIFSLATSIPYSWNIFSKLMFSSYSFSTQNPSISPHYLWSVFQTHCRLILNFSLTVSSIFPPHCPGFGLQSQLLKSYFATHSVALLWELPVISVQWNSYFPYSKPNDLSSLPLHPGDCAQCTLLLPSASFESLSVIELYTPLNCQYLWQFLCLFSMSISLGTAIIFYITDDHTQNQQRSCTYLALYKHLLKYWPG
jgi:hypothetical protein